MKYELTKEDVALIVEALDNIDAYGPLSSLISGPKHTAIAQRVEQIKSKLKPNEDETTD